MKPANASIPKNKMPRFCIKFVDSYPDYWNSGEACVVAFLF